MVVTQVSHREVVAVTMANVAEFNHNVVLMVISKGEVTVVVVVNLYPPIIKICHSTVIVLTLVQRQWCLDQRKIKISHVMGVANVVT